MKNVALESERNISIIYEVTDIGQNNHSKLVSSTTKFGLLNNLLYKTAVKIIQLNTCKSFAHYMEHCKSLLKARYFCSNNQMHT